MAKLESGHAKNMSNYDELLSYVLGYGTVYNPNKPAIQLSALQALQPKIHSAMDTVNQMAVVYHRAIAARSHAFAPMSKLITRILNAEIASDTNSQTDDNIKSLVRKFRGTHSKVKSTTVKAVNATPTTGQATTPTTGSSVTTTVTKSSSQKGYDTLLDTFDKIIKTLIGIPQYQPNEVDITTAALTTLYNDLHAKNAAVVSAHVDLSNANIARYNLCYAPNTGMVDLTIDVKNYVKSISGAVAPQYKQISKLPFKNFPLF
jgi:hypothetical protein